MSSAGATRRIALAAAVSFAVAGCGSHAGAPSPAGTTSTTSATHVAGGSAASIYPLAFDLRDQDDRSLPLDAFRGSPVVVTMFYASCPAACPLLVSHVKELDAMLAPDVRSRVRVLFVSFDPAHDGPDVLRATAARHHVDGRWRFATGAPDDVRQLAAALGIAYRPMPGGGYAHDSVLTVLDGDGRVVARTDDPSADLRPLADALTAAAR